MSTMRCKCRRHAETSLRCARCSVPICPDCSRIAPAGMLCRECGSGRHSPLFQVSASGLALGYAGSLSAGIVGGWILSGFGLGMGFLGLILAFVDGIAVGEVALRLTGRKRGLQMEIMAGVCAALGVIGGVLAHLLMLPTISQSFAQYAPVLLQHYLTSPMTYIVVAIAAYGAVSRIRNI